jgi:hypothetical protein
MCQKIRIFKQFHAVMISHTPLSQPKTLQVFKYPPTTQQVDRVIEKYVLNKKSEPTPFIYSEKPQIYVVPIHISPDILV